MKLVLAYDGTDFRGWARQRTEVRTVQGVLEDALEPVLGFRPALDVAGRTDAGVHASGQVCSFPVPEGTVDVERLRRAVHKLLAPEVVVREASLAPPGFHARFSATARVYRYRIDVGEAPDPFTARFVWHRPGALSLGRMRAAAHELVGEHDFASFCRSPQDGGSVVRRLERLSVGRAGDRIDVVARANAFCHQMVRALVGTIADVGEGRMSAGSIPEVLAARDRAAAGRLAPPHGLTLERVIYGSGAGRGRVAPRAGLSSA